MIKYNSSIFFIDILTSINTNTICFNNIYKPIGPINNFIFNYLNNKPYGHAIYSIIISFMISCNAYIVGGWVRDILSKKNPNDISIFISSFLDITYENCINIIKTIFNNIYKYENILIESIKINKYINCGKSLHIVISTIDNNIIITFNIMLKYLINCDVNIEFIQNSLAFKYNYINNDIELFSLCEQSICSFDYYIYLPKCYNYINFRKNTTLYILLKLIFNNNTIYDYIINLVELYLGKRWILSYTILYTLCKPSPEMYLYHEICIYNMSEKHNHFQKKNSYNKIQKFIKRNYNIMGMYKCNKKCVRYCKKESSPICCLFF